MSTADLIIPASGRAKIVLGVEGMASPQVEIDVERTLARLPGVSARASFAEQTVKVEFDRSTCAVPEIVRRLYALGLKLRGQTGTAGGARFAIPPPAPPKLPDVLAW